jgi:ABC-type uncharacterized transport system ATPase subunit
MTDLALSIHDITKRFGATVANDHINLDIGRGEIHAILGENGAGKTTLMNMLYGLYKPDAGSISVYGQPVSIDSPREASALGIQMVHQHFMLGLPFTVAENLVIGYEPTQGGVLLDLRKARDAVRTLSDRYGLNVDPDTRIRSLSVGLRQRVEILKALYREARILILDEPTAVLSPLEIAELFAIMRRLKSEDKTVLFITHKLHEVMSIADRVTALRHGRLVGTHDVDEVTEEQLVQMMVGRLIEPETPDAVTGGGHPVLQINELSASDPLRGVEVLHNLNLEAKAGEILGIAGVEGNGQSELVEVLIGLRPIGSGRVVLDGKIINGLSPRRIMECGVACIHEDRQSRGLIGDFTISENLILGEQYRAPYRKGVTLESDTIATHAQKLIESFDIRPRDPDILAKYLSGGNQQKLVAARELSNRHMRLLIASQPTRGLDVGATRFIHRQLRIMRERGAAVLLISADLDEVKLLSDRIAIIYKGEIVATGARGTFTDTELGVLMMRGRHEVDLQGDLV